MDLKQVQIVLSVAKNLNFSEAAWETSYAASVVSKQVAAIEKELGVRIFERKARSKVKLTEIGEELLPSLTKIQEEYNRIKSVIGSAGHQDAITLVCPCGFSTLGEDELISIFSAHNPQFSVRQIVGSNDSCRDLLLNGDADISIRLFSSSELVKYLDSKEFCCVKLAEARVGIVLKEGHPAIQDGKVELAQLRSERFLFRAFKDNMEGDPKVEAFQNACRREGFEPQVQFERDMRTSAALALVAKGMYAIPVMHRPNVLYPGTFYAPFTRNYYSFSIILLYQRANTSQALKEFVRCAKENRCVFSKEIID